MFNTHKVGNLEFKIKWFFRNPNYNLKYYFHLFLRASWFISNFFFLEEASYIWNFSAFIARSSLSIKTYLIQKKELQECRLTLLASYKSIIGIILFNLSTTISLKKIFCHIFLALELHLLFFDWFWLPNPAYSTHYWHIFN